MSGGQCSSGKMRPESDGGFATMVAYSPLGAVRDRDSISRYFPGPERRTNVQDLGRYKQIPSTVISAQIVDNNNSAVQITTGNLGTNWIKNNSHKFPPHVRKLMQTTNLKF